MNHLSADVSADAHGEASAASGSSANPSPEPDIQYLVSQFEALYTACRLAGVPKFSYQHGTHPNAYDRSHRLVEWLHRQRYVDPASVSVSCDDEGSIVVCDRQSHAVSNPGSNETEMSSTYAERIKEKYGINVNLYLD